MYKKFMVKEKVWYSPTDEYKYVIDSMSILSGVIGDPKDMRRHSYFKNELYPNSIFILMKQYIKETDSWKNVFKNDKLFEYFIRTNIKPSTFKRDTSLNYIVFTNDGITSYTGSYITFKGIYKIESINENDKVIIYNKISDKFELKEDI